MLVQRWLNADGSYIHMNYISGIYNVAVLRKNENGEPIQVFAARFETREAAVKWFNEHKVYTHHG